MKSYLSLTYFTEYIYILVYLYIDGEGEKQRACDSLIMCIVTTLNQGLRNGGGIGDVLRKPNSKVQSIYVNYIGPLYGGPCQNVLL